MKILKIKDNKGYFINENDEYIELDKLEREHLICLIRKVIENKDADFEQYDESLLHNKAHQIIYKSIFNKLTDFQKNRDAIIEKKNKLYSEAVKKYSVKE